MKINVQALPPGQCITYFTYGARKMVHTMFSQSPNEKGQRVPFMNIFFLVDFTFHYSQLLKLLDVRVRVSNNLFHSTIMGTMRIAFYNDVLVLLSLTNGKRDTVTFILVNQQEICLIRFVKKTTKNRS